MSSRCREAVPATSQRARAGSNVTVRSATPGDTSGDPRFRDFRQNGLISMPLQILRNVGHHPTAAATMPNARSVRRGVDIRTRSVGRAARTASCASGLAVSHLWQCPARSTTPTRRYPQAPSVGTPQTVWIGRGTARGRESESGHPGRRSESPRRGVARGAAQAQSSRVRHPPWPGVGRAFPAGA